MGQEASSSIYDELHAQENPSTPVEKSIYYRLFCRIVAEVEKRQIDSVLEVGCGTGGLAAVLMKRTSVHYRGFDFSTVGIRRAAERTARPDAFFVSDALDPASYNLSYNGVISTEVLEHIAHDRDVIALWKPGVHCICSVPNFDFPTHVRYFRHEDEVRARYGELIDIDMLTRLPKPVLANLTLREYLRKVRWAREQPKKMLGLLGINTFDWLAGWFVFAGRRKS